MTERVLSMKKIVAIWGGLFLFLVTSQVQAATLVGVWSGTATIVSQAQSADVGKYFSLKVSIQITKQVGNRFEATTIWKGNTYKIYGFLKGDSIYASADSATISGKLVNALTMDLTAQVASKGETLAASGVLKKE